MADMLEISNRLEVALKSELEALSGHPEERLASIMVAAATMLEADSRTFRVAAIVAMTALANYVEGARGCDKVSLH